MNVHENQKYLWVCQETLERERELLEECVNLRGERDSDFIDRHINRGSIC